MPPKTRAEDDDWHSVADAKKRKQIQDRLAQRARRKRLRDQKELKKENHTCTCTPTSTSSEISNVIPDAQSSQIHQSLNQLTQISPALGEDESIQFIPQPPPTTVGSFFSTNWTSTPDTSADLSPSEMAIITPLSQESTPPDFSNPSPLSQVHFPFNIFTALYLNGLVLGQICSMGVPSKSSPATPSLPLPLHPTELQLTTLHHSWIDRLPFPKARDAMISFSAFINEEEFLNDVMTAPSFELVPGRVPWDPRAYRIVKGFREKWGWLFFY